MGETSNTLKNERIREVENASENPVIEKDVQQENSSAMKTKEVNKLIYPIGLGLLGGSLGFFAAKQFSFCTKCAIVGGVVIGVAAGLMFNQKTKKND